MKFCNKLLAVLLLLMLVACSSGKPHGGSRPLVVVTTGVIADIVEHIGGDFVEIKTLIVAGSDPHSYKANENDVIDIARAMVTFYNGLQLEGAFGHIIERASSTIPVYAVCEYIPSNKLIEVKKGVYDPHVWLDPQLWILAVNRVADGLVETDPANAVYYRRNEDAYIEQIIAVNDSIKSRLDTVPPEKRVIVSAHNAFSMSM
ncbi:hypothetical protein RsTz2092_13720 [Deferribacterales bacterium RsTz2092]|nr:hypothetical protein AGMMS49941_12990 [Deferribacterales bacterium]